MKKILFIAPFESPHIRRWFNFFNNNQEIDAHLLICYNLFRNKNIMGKALEIFTLKAKIIRIIDTLDPEIVNLHTLLFPNYLLTRHIKCKVVITPWNGDLLWYKHGKELLFIRYINLIAKGIKEIQIKKSLNKANLITCNSYEMEKRVLSLIQKDIPIANIEVPGIDTKKWTKVSKIEKFRIRKELNLPQDHFIILSPRSLGDFYNIDIIISTFHRVLMHDDKYLLILIYHSSGGLNKLKKLVANYEIKENVFFIGKVDYEEGLKYLQSSDLSISISSKDSSPQSVIEGLSCGIPMIVGDIPVLNEIIINDYNGFIIPCRDSVSLAKKIIEIKENPELIEEITYNGIMKAVEKYDYFNNMSKMLELFLQL